MSETHSSDDIKYNEYPKFYFEVLKGLTKSLVVKKEVKLDNKINNCIKEYKSLLERMGYTNIKSETENFINFAIKLASWYEMKFPDFKIHNLFVDKNLNLTPEFFISKNDPIYNTSTFFDKYIPNEKYMIISPTYPKYIVLDSLQYLEVSKKGIVKNTNISEYKKFIGKHISEVSKIIRKTGIELAVANKIDEEIENFNDKSKLREILLYTIMYIIMKRGGVRIGPRRALLFAKEFKLDIDIPMQYSIDTSDANDITLIKIYLNNGGKRDLELFINYFSDGIENILFDKITIDEYISRFANDDIDFFTKEQLDKKILYQRMVNSINCRRLSLKLKNEDIVE